jgi:hypothetical protein
MKSWTIIWEYERGRTFSGYADRFHNSRLEVGAAIAAPIRTGAEISLSSMMRRL